MFRKTFRVQKSNPMRSTDRKKLRGLVLKLYPAAEPEIDRMIPIGEGEVLVLKLSNKCTVWSLNVGQTAQGGFDKFGQPMFFAAQHEEDKLVYPTVYSLWIEPNMMPAMFTHVEVSPYIFGGADLMMAGVLKRRNGTFGGMSKGEPRCIVAVENPVPYAVGPLLLGEQNAAARQGKALQVLHHFGDALWSFGGGSKPNEGFELSCIQPFEIEVKAEDAKREGSDVKGAESIGQPVSSADQDRSESHRELVNQAEGLSVEDQAVECENRFPEYRLGSAEVDEDPDRALRYAFVITVGKLYRDGKYPVAASWLYEEYIKHIAPDLDLVRTTSKSFSLFLRTMSKRHYCKTKEVDGEVQLTQVSLKNIDALGKQIAAVGSDNESADEGVQPDGMTAEDMDDLLLRVFMQAALVGLDPEEDAESFPMESSAFYSKVLVSCQPYDLPIDVKRSSFKKLSAFLKYLAKEEYCKLKEARGHILILGVNREHPNLRNYKPYEMHSQKQRTGSTPRSGFSPPKIETMLKPHQQQAKLFMYVGCNPQGEYTKKAAAGVLERYVQERQLVREDNRDPRLRVIDVDDVLMRSLSKPSKPYGDEMEQVASGERASFRTIQERFLSRLEAYYAVEAAGGRRVVKKGEVPKVKVTCEDRQGGRKHVTKCHGIEIYGVDPKVLANKCQVAFACTASTHAMPGKNNTAVEVRIQGDVSGKLEELLVTEFHIPRHHIISR